VTTPAGTGSKASGFTVTAKEKPAKKSNAGKIWLGVGIGLAVVALGAAIAYFVMRKRASQKAARPSRRK
jgi:flagellar basal body-associated protein FliL